MRLLPRIKEVWYDEHNVFEQVLGNLTGPRGGRWWTPGFDASVGHRTVLFLRRRSGVSGRSFRTFVRDRFAHTIHQAGGRDLRAYTFVPYSSLNYPTPGVSHDNPPHRRYHGIVVLGTDTRADLDALRCRCRRAGGLFSLTPLVTAQVLFPDDFTRHLAGQDCGGQHRARTLTLQD